MQLPQEAASLVQLIAGTSGLRPPYPSLDNTNGSSGNSAGAEGPSPARDYPVSYFTTCARLATLSVPRPAAGLYPLRPE